MKPERVQRKRSKGWKMPVDTVYVGRPTQWGNPFAVSTCISLEQALNLYRALVARDYRVLRTMPWTAGLALSSGPYKSKRLMQTFLAPLRGKNLACWCRLDQACHADVLLELANAVDERDNDR